MRELDAIIDAGFGEVEIAFSPGFWADDAQREALGAVLAHAERRGVGVASTLGAAWPLQTPNTAKGTDYAAQELQYGVTYIDGSLAHSVPVPTAFDDPEGLRGATLLAVTAARVVQRGDAPAVEQVTGWTGQVERRIVGPETSTILDGISALDITDRAVDGLIRWSGGGSGEWAIFAFWVRDCEQGVTSFIDRSAALAATAYLDEHQIGDANRETLSRAGTDLFEDSLELNADSLFWSHDLIARFTRRHGYDPTPHLPTLFAHGMCRYWVPADEPTPDFEYQDGSGSRVRRDYYRLLTDLYIDDHLLVLQDWSRSLGLRHKAQVAYGQNLEPVRSNRHFARAGGRVEAESLNSGDRAPVDRDHALWRYALDWQRAIVAGAHQGGTVRISTELGAQFTAAYALTLGDYKQMLDKEWAAGITKPFVHGYATQADGAPWPTQSRFFDFIAESWNDLHFPEWQNWKPLTDYWARGTAVLETGVARTDVAVIRDGFLTTAARGMPNDDETAPGRLTDAVALERSGYSVQFVDPLGLVEDDAIGRDGTLFPTGPAYRALIIDERALPAKSVAAIASAAELGLRVVFVGELPHQDSGFAAGAAGHADVQAAVSRMLGLANVERVEEMSDSAAGLDSLGLVPRASWHGLGLLTQWREADDRCYLLVYNPYGSASTVTLSLEGEGRVRELQLWTGEITSVPSTREGGRTILPTHLGPLSLRMFEIAPGDDLTTTEATGARWHELEISNWSLTVDSEEARGSQTIIVDGQGPADWRSVPSLETVSGTGRYVARVDGSGFTEFALDLGRLAGSAVVRVAERVVGVAYVSDSVLPLGDALTGSSRIDIEVRTALRNAVVAAGGRPMLGDTTQPQGLIGPVRVLAR